MEFFNTKKWIMLADTLEPEYKSSSLSNMGRKDAAKIAQQLIAAKQNHRKDPPVQILEAGSTKREHLWSSTLEKLAAGKADDWFDSNLPALIMVGEASYHLVFSAHQSRYEGV